MKRNLHIWFSSVIIVFGFCLKLNAGSLDVAEEALLDKLYSVAQVNAERCLQDAASEDHLRALEVLLESLAHQGNYAGVLSALEKNNTLVVQSGRCDSLLYWRVLALFNEGMYTDVSNIINSGRVGTNTLYGISTMRVGARTRDITGDFSGAVELFSQVDAVTDDAAIRSSNAFEWALALDKRGKSVEALQVLKRLSQMDLNNDSVNDGALLRGRILMKLGRVDEANRIFDALAMNERVAEIPRVQALVEMSVYKLSAAKTNEAIAYARSAYERAQLPETRKLSGYRLGDLLCSSVKSVDEGSKLIKSLVREFPEDDDSMRAHLKLADAFLQLGRADDAAEEYRIFLETYPSSALDTLVMQGRGWALFQLGRYTESAVAFEKAADLTDDLEEKAECIFKHCDALMSEKRYVDAAAAYADLNKRFPDSKFAGKALYLSAEALERSGDKEAARELYLKTSARYPHKSVSSDSLLRVASILAESQELDQSVDTYTLIVKNYTNVTVTARAYMGRGKVYYSKYSFEKAMQDFAAVAEVDPQRLDEARYYLILSLYGLGRDGDALDSAETFVINFPASRFYPDMLLWLGKFHFNRANYSAAVKYFEDYASGFADRKWADAALLWGARAMFRSGDFTTAIETVTQMVNKYPKSSLIEEARFVQAESLIELARFDAAILLLDGILESAPDGRWGQMALLRKGNCLFALGAGNRVRYEEALAVYEHMTRKEGLTSAVMIELYYKIGRCLEKLERLDEAVDCYYSQVLLRFFKERSSGTWYDETTLSLVVRASFSAAEIFEKQGRNEQAISVLKRIVKLGSVASDEAQRRINVMQKVRIR